MNTVSNRQDFAQQVIIQLLRMGLEVTPVSFELMHEVLSGDNPDLRQQFITLGKHVTAEDVERLARNFLPHHFGHSALDSSASLFSEELQGFQDALSNGQEALSAYATVLTQASEQFSRADPRDSIAIRRAIDHVSQATAAQKVATNRMMRSVSERIETVKAIRHTIDQSERAKFTDGPTALGNRRAFNRRLGEIFHGDRGIDGYTLILCRISGLEQFDRPELAKARAYFLARFGGFARKLLKGREGGYWLGQPHLAFIVFGTEESYVAGVTRRLHEAIAEIVGALRHSIATAPVLTGHYGCAASSGAGAPPELLGHAITALETSTLHRDGTPVFYGARAAVSSDSRNYALYGRARMF
ncbi:diguanylate cyclase [Rhizobium sp. SG_E_25_P2]|uniref:hypothetical protein n=1 Tax=Rhizobium sp. SG_E_25_P2 TaxID=2879942 RepID=UPI0024749AA1|nr:hypothetical protein [Rhizobium sp. SG_E_25_P2]MDH6269898.1 diguanylate cyclase [Rhizobium sp. SG_E_25_P2]